MLGWMMRRGENAPDAIGGADSTIGDQPDTPAPVFAARAFKSALFGTPAPRNDEIQRKDNATKEGPASDTPSKRQGILLTPGTGTTRRKRVSFGHDIYAKNNASPKDTGAQRRTRLSQVLESSRRKSSNAPTNSQPAGHKSDSEDDWEEEEEDDADADDHCSHDITLDLNEPHSQSGRYWKEEFDRYHRDAKDEMEKLLRYKQLAKSYAQQKDAEANQLAEMLKDEQQKVISMEKKIAENASQIVSQHRQTSDGVSDEMITKLTKQTTLAAQYRLRVQDLETQLEDFLRAKGDDEDTKGRRRRHLASPNTQKTIMETQRELRRARAQVKEMDSLREEVKSLKRELKAVKAASRGETKPPETPRAKDLRAQLKQAQDESVKKENEIAQLKSDFDSFRQESELHDADTKAVLERAHTKIADLKKEVKALKTAAPEEPRSQSSHPRTQSEDINREIAKLESITKGISSEENARNSFDLAELGGNDPYRFKTRDTKARNLREKYQEDTANNDVQQAKSATNALADRPTLDKPRWQPFVPRSPRNRAYLSDDLASRIQQGGATSAATSSRDVLVPDLPALAKSIRSNRRATSADEGEANIDLLQDRFARLGGPVAQGRSTSDGSGSNNIDAAVSSATSKSRLPPERRAAAMARIEKRMAEKKRAQRRQGSDKENVCP